MHKKFCLLFLKLTSKKWSSGKKVRKKNKKENTWKTKKVAISFFFLIEKVDSIWSQKLPLPRQSKSWLPLWLWKYSFYLFKGLKIAAGCKRKNYKHLIKVNHREKKGRKLSPYEICILYITDIFLPINLSFTCIDMNSFQMPHVEICSWDRRLFHSEHKKILGEGDLSIT